MTWALEVGRWCEAYRPRRLSQQEWQAIRPFVERVLIEGGAVDARTLRQTGGLVARLSAERIASGLPLSVDAILSPTSIAHFVDSFSEASPVTRSRYGTLLRRLGRRVASPGVCHPWGAGSRSRAALIDNYVPTVITRREWDEVRPFVTSTVHDFDSPLKTTARYLRLVSGLAAWCLAQGVPLTRADALSRDAVEGYLASNDELTVSWRNYRFDLRRIARALSPSEAWPEPQLIDRYQPTIISKADWDGPLGAFVRSTVRSVMPADSPQAPDCARMLIRITEWATSRGYPLELGEILAPEAVESFIAEVDLPIGTLSLYAPRLRRLGRELAPKAWPPEPRRFSRRKYAPPFTDVDERVLWRVASGQATATRRRNMEGALCLGFGAGLDGRWITDIWPYHVHVDPDGGLLLEVTRPDRLVPVQHRYAPLLRELAGTALDAPIIGNAEGRKVNKLVGELEIPRGAPRLVLGRCRSTWLLRNVAAGVPIPDIAEAAGVKTAEFVTEFLPLLPRLGSRERRQAMWSV
jgi:hypothetical protein